MTRIIYAAFIDAVLSLPSTHQPGWGWLVAVLFNKLQYVYLGVEIENTQDKHNKNNTPNEDIMYTHMAWWDASTAVTTKQLLWSIAVHKHVPLKLHTKFWYPTWFLFLLSIVIYTSITYFEMICII